MKILVTDIAWGDLEIETEVLRSAGAEPVLAGDTREDTLAHTAGNCSAIMTCWGKTTAKVIGACPDCRIVARFGIGLDNIDVAYCSSRNVPVTNVPDYCIHEVADHTMALLLALARKVSYHDRQIHGGSYQLLDGYPLRRLQGQQLGIVGFGRIGRQVAARARAFGLKVVVNTRSLSAEEAGQLGVERVTLNELLGNADYVSLHLPMTPDTAGLIGEAELRRMRPGSFLINTSRGGLVDHDALLQTLEAGSIQGVAMDVTDPEPLPAGHPLNSHPLVIHTPHSAFYSVESVEELRRRTAEEVVRALRGEPLQHCVNRAEISG